MHFSPGRLTLNHDSILLQALPPNMQMFKQKQASPPVPSQSLICHCILSCAPPRTTVISSNNTNKSHCFVPSPQ